MAFRRHDLLKQLMAFAIAICNFAPAHAQMVETPLGDLRVGMSEEEASRILHSRFEESGGVNTLRERSAGTTVGGKSFIAAATSKHVVYSVSSQQFFQTADLGRQAAQETALRYHKEFGPSVPITSYDNNGFKYQSWTIPGGPIVWVELHCQDTLVVFKLMDYSRKAADDGDDTLHYVVMGPIIDTLCF